MKRCAVVFSYCEPVTAGPLAVWHIRRLTAVGHKPTGGADTKALCGLPVAWDIPCSIRQGDADTEGVCPACADAYRANRQSL